MGHRGTSACRVGRSVRTATHHDPMWIARLTCSDDGCPDEFDAVAETLAELETLACACGCALHVIGFADRAD